MKQRKLVIWGASGHASVVANIIRLVGKYEIAGFLDSINPERKKTKFCGSTILGGAEQLDNLRKAGVTNMIFGFGDCEARLRLAKIARKVGFSLITAVHPDAVVATDVRIGDGSVLAAGAVINPGTKIADNVIINTCASVDHDCVIKEGVHVCPGVHLGGGVVIGRATWVGIGSTVMERVCIGDHSFIGAGSVVLRNIPSKVLAFGVPAKVRKEGLKQ